MSPTGIAVGGGAALLALLLGALCFVRRRAARKRRTATIVDVEKLEPKEDEAPEPVKPLPGFPPAGSYGGPPAPPPGPFGGRASSVDAGRRPGGDLQSLDSQLDSRMSGRSAGEASAVGGGPVSPDALFVGRESPFDQEACARAFEHICRQLGTLLLALSARQLKLHRRGPRAWPACWARPGLGVADALFARRALPYG